MPTLLEKLKLTELSLVDKGANQHASVTIFKRDASSEADKGGSSADSTAETKDDPNMAATEAQVTELTKSVEALTKSLEDTKTELAKAEKLAKASDAVKAHMAKLSDEEKAKFMALSTEDQEKKAAAVKKADETIELHGQTIAKSAVGDGMFSILKAQSEEIRKANERIEKAEREAEIQVLAKRADDELAALPGDRLAKARILKAANALSADDKTTFDAMLKAANSTLAKAFTTVGKSGAGNAEAGTAEEEIEKAAKEIAKRDNVSIHKAREKVGIERPELYEAVEA